MKPHLSGGVSGLGFRAQGPSALHPVNQKPRVPDIGPFHCKCSSLFNNLKPSIQTRIHLGFGFNVQDFGLVDYGKDEYEYHQEAPLAMHLFFSGSRVAQNSKPLDLHSACSASSPIPPSYTSPGTSGKYIHYCTSQA